jgi:galactose mutarotase-like enzyme
MQHLENDYLRISASSSGAELTRIFDKKHSLERLWDADPAVWNRHAPILFPIVGRLLENRYVYGGKEYSLPQHGFARDCVFELKRQTTTTLSYELTDSENTRADYPFAFVLQVDYTLHKNQVRVAYTVSNPGTQTLYFSIGGHPGFACPLMEGEVFSDYYIEFEKKETCARWYADQNGLIYKKEADYLRDTAIIPYTMDRFREDALVFKELQSSRVSIKSFKNAHAVTLEFPGWPYLGIWSKPGGAPFICLEPWYGIADHTGHSGELTRKEGIMPLDPGLNFCCEYGLIFT